jgi:hypothetical protein
MDTLRESAKAGTPSARVWRGQRAFESPDRHSTPSRLI